MMRDPALRILVLPQVGGAELAMKGSCMDLVGDLGKQFDSLLWEKQPRAIASLARLVEIAIRSHDLFTQQQILELKTEGAGFIVTLRLTRFITIWAGTVTVELVYYPHSVPAVPAFPSFSAEVELSGDQLLIKHISDPS